MMLFIRILVLMVEHEAIRTNIRECLFLLDNAPNLPTYAVRDKVVEKTKKKNKQHSIYNDEEMLESQPQHEEKFGKLYTLPKKYYTGLVAEKGTIAYVLKNHEPTYHTWQPHLRVTLKKCLREDILYLISYYHPCVQDILDVNPGLKCPQNLRPNEILDDMDVIKRAFNIDQLLAWLTPQNNKLPRRRIIADVINHQQWYLRYRLTCQLPHLMLPHCFLN